MMRMDICQKTNMRLTHACRSNAQPLGSLNGARLRAHTLVPRSQSTISESSKVVAEGKEKIYVGKGRFIEDDPKKYPERNALTGGFAGGEVCYAWNSFRTLNVVI